MKKNKILFVVLLSIISLSAFAQSEPLKKQVDVGILYPSFSAEFPLANKFTIYGRGGIGSGGVGGVAFGGDGFGLMYRVMPMYTLQGRYYFNGIKSETKKGKALVGNSGAYGFLAAQGHTRPFLTSHENEENNGIFIIGGGLGMQRTYTNRFVWSFGLGYGYSTGGFTGIGEFKLGINLFTK